MRHFRKRSPQPPTSLKRQRRFSQCDAAPSLALQAGACLLLALVLLPLAGCSPRRPPMAPVNGKVVYKGQPLTFGSVMFQPEGGQPARGDIQPDGTFVLSTYREGDGAAIGKHRVRVTCFEGQKVPISAPSDLERPLGKPLIPRRYASIDTSGLSAEVQKQNEPVVLELVDE